jgi:hypothetical protein
LHRERHRLIQQRVAHETASKVCAHLNAGKIKALVNLNSIGPEFATTLVGEKSYRLAFRRCLAMLHCLG